MNTITCRILDQGEYDLILPLAHLLNEEAPISLLKERLGEMMNQGYQCLAAFDGEEIVGICGMWITTRFYCGKQVEVDNVVVVRSYRSKGIGKIMMNWVYDYAASIGCATCELNAYVSNGGAHRFYFKEGFDILGFHFQKNFIQ